MGFSSDRASKTIQERFLMTEWFKFKDFFNIDSKISSFYSRTFGGHCISTCLFCLTYSPFNVPVKMNFRRYFCEISPNQPQTHLYHWRILDELWGWNFNLIWQQMKNLPIDPYCKNCSFSATSCHCRKWAYLQWWSMGKFVTDYVIQMKFCLRVRLSLPIMNDQIEFDWARCNKSIAENSNSLGHGMNSTPFYNRM